VTYSDGVRAVAAQNWNTAIANLNDAIRFDPQPRTYHEGVLQMDYFPQYYLFVAYLKRGDLAKSRQFYESRGNLPARLMSDARRYYDELTLAEQKPRH
jgi:hypothetical protein